MYAKVVVDVNAKRVDKLFDYAVPGELEAVIAVGMRVVVPFGPRKIQGYIIELVTGESAKPLKAIHCIQDVTPELNAELIELSAWMQETHIAKRIAVLDVMLPNAVKGKYQKVYRLMADDIPNEVKQLFNKQGIRKIGDCALEEVMTLEPFIATGQVIEDIDVSQQQRIKMQKAVTLSGDIDRALAMLRTDKQKSLVELVADRRTITLKELKEMDYSAAVINGVVSKGILKKIEIEETRDPYKDRVFFADDRKVLRPEQEAAYHAIKAAVDAERNDVFLLHGITGSGKTEVYLQAISDVLDKGMTALMLVPEIALTPQMVERFKARFGDEVAVLHSGLSAGERYDEWRKIRSGEARVSVGARSSIFAPFTNLGLIIIDEEHEASYKQADYPRYHARDIAQWRAAYNHCPVILGSATPSLESYARAEKGVYTLLTIKERANQFPVPSVEVINMRDELAAGNRSMFSETLTAAINDRIQKGEQIVLFLNRRGHAQFMLCRDCGYVPQCPNCDISLTYHKVTDDLKCHYCGYKEPKVLTCPNCDSDHIREMGVGTQKVEELIYQHFDGAKVIRMDNDTTSRKGAHERLLTQFKNGEANILLGTQMIAKGLDFPNITLVGVLNADTMLNLPDFRSAERTYQLLTQVAGRAGRAEKEGHVIIQTYNPDHYAIEHAKNNDFSGFYTQEMQFRKVGKYPPYFYLVNLVFSHSEMKRVLLESRHIHDVLLQHLTPGSFVLGPAPCAIGRINNQYRFQIIIKFKAEPELLKALTYLDDYYYEQFVKDKFSLSIDINPQTMM
ncbi:primosomal protein N' [Macrococcus equipercicus]|uniref:Replication restart protein PriA n=1 Tax=Macrococcus equipercicus TaxID=69967 RepID=A0ABQ6RC32_9STAP|nr:primosomal protein N' [Macrococcus equipercicus]KAA1042741.1 primosomal protein N' [Macrococcus equipercicus]